MFTPFKGLVYPFLPLLLLLFLLHHSFYNEQFINEQHFIYVTVFPLIETTLSGQVHFTEQKPSTTQFSLKMTKVKDYFLLKWKGAIPSVAYVWSNKWNYNLVWFNWAPFSFTFMGCQVNSEAYSLQSALYWINSKSSWRAQLSIAETSSAKANQQNSSTPWRDETCQTSK